MSRPHASVILATYNRAHLLKLSIEGYNRLRFPLDKLEVIVVDDGSVDDTQQVCELFDSRIDLKYIKLRKQPGLWRDCAAVINCGIRAAKGSTILLTHPEILPGADAVGAVCDNAVGVNWVSCKGYYLNPEQQTQIDTVNWRQEGPKAFRQLPDFYADPLEKLGHLNADYLPANIDRVGTDPTHHKVWESWIFAGCSRKLMSELGGLYESPHWGVIDLNLHARRVVLGLNTVTPTGDDEIVCHFNHDVAVGDFKTTVRDIDTAHQHAPPMNPRTACYPAINELWGPILNYNY